eukprot:2131157-Rhodomonas_salina.1
MCVSKWWEPGVAEGGGGAGDCQGQTAQSEHVGERGAAQSESVAQWGNGAGSGSVHDEWAGVQHERVGQWGMGMGYGGVGMAMSSAQPHASGHAQSGHESRGAAWGSLQPSFRPRPHHSPLWQPMLPAQDTYSNMIPRLQTEAWAWSGTRCAAPMGLQPGVHADASSLYPSELADAVAAAEQAMTHKTRVRVLRVLARSPEGCTCSEVVHASRMDQDLRRSVNSAPRSPA